MSIPNFATQEQLKKLRRLIVWRCHNCKEIGFTIDYVDKKGKDTHCRSCWHTYRSEDVLADSWSGMVNKGKSLPVMFTTKIVPEYDATAPWVFAWLGQRCECGDLVYIPYDKNNVLKHTPYHQCNMRLDAGLVSMRLQTITAAVKHVHQAHDRMTEHLVALEDELYRLQKDVSQATPYQKPR